MKKIVVIDDTKYAPCGEAIAGNRHIVVLHRGFVFVGDVSDEGDEVTVSSAYNVRKWTRGGFGGLTESGTQSGATLDPCADFKYQRSVSEICRVPVAEGWNA